MKRASRTIAAAVLLGALSAIPFVGSAAAAAKAPKTVTVSASKSTLIASGGSVTIRATVKSAKTCAWSVSPKVKGFDASVKCAAKLSRVAKFPANTTKSAKRFTFSLDTVSGKIKASGSAVVSEKGKAAKSTPAPLPPTTTTTTTTTTTAPRVVGTPVVSLALVGTTVQISWTYAGTTPDTFLIFDDAKETAGVTYPYTTFDHVSGTSMSFTVQNLTVGVRRCFAVAANWESGGSEGPFSSDACITPPFGLTVSLSRSSGQLFTGVGFTLTASAVSVMSPNTPPVGTVTFGDGDGAISFCSNEPLIASPYYQGGIATCSIEYSQPGTYTITASASSSDGSTGSGTLTITVSS